MSAAEKRLVLWGGLAAAIISIAGVFVGATVIVSKVKAAVDLPAAVAKNSIDIRSLKTWRKKKETSDYYVRYYVTEIAKKNGITVPPAPPADLGESDDEPDH